MALLPQSARARRRLGRAAAGALAVGAAIATVVLLPEGRTLDVAPTRSAAQPAPRATPAPVKRERKVELTPAVRREINRSLAQFIPAAVERKEPALAWELAGPKLRTGWTKRDWLNDQIPVFPFSARSTGFEGWRKLYSYERRVGLDLVIQPASSKVGALAVGVEMVRRDGRWLVNEWVPVATFTPAEGRQWVTGIADFNAGGWTDKGLERDPTRARLGGTWILAPIGVLGLVLVIPAAIGLSVARRNRRARLAYTASRSDSRVTWRSS